MEHIRHFESPTVANDSMFDLNFLRIFSMKLVEIKCIGSGRDEKQYSVRLLCHLKRNDFNPFQKYLPFCAMIM